MALTVRIEPQKRGRLFPNLTKMAMGIRCFERNYFVYTKPSEGLRDLIRRMRQPYLHPDYDLWPWGYDYCGVRFLIEEKRYGYPIKSRGTFIVNAKKGEQFLENDFFDRGIPLLWGVDCYRRFNPQGKRFFSFDFEALAIGIRSLLQGPNILSGEHIVRQIMEHPQHLEAPRWPKRLARIFVSHRGHRFFLRIEPHGVKDLRQKKSGHYNWFPDSENPGILRVPLRSNPDGIIPPEVRITAEPYRLRYWEIPESLETFYPVLFAKEIARVLHSLA